METSHKLLHHIYVQQMQLFVEDLLTHNQSCIPVERVRIADCIGFVLVLKRVHIKVKVNRKFNLKQLKCFACQFNIVVAHSATVLQVYRSTGLQGWGSNPHSIRSYLATWPQTNFLYRCDRTYRVYPTLCPGPISKWKHRSTARQSAKVKAEK